LDAASVAQLFDRAAHFSKVVSAFGGSGCAWSYTFPDGETHRYIINGIKSPDQLEHEVLTLAIWLWSLKDYLKGRAATLGRDPQDVEAYASGDPSLALSADIANAAKHGKLTNSRSGKWPKLGRLRYEIPQEAMRSVTFRAFEVETDVARPDLVTLELPILDSNGLEIGDALQLMTRALSAWERFNKELERAD